MPFQPLRKGEQFLKENVHVFGIVRELQFLLGSLVDHFETDLFVAMLQKGRIQLGNDVLSSLLVGIQVGGVRPADEQVVR